MKYPIESDLKTLLGNFCLLANFHSTNCMAGQRDVIDKDFIVVIDSDVPLDRFIVYRGFEGHRMQAMARPAPVQAPPPFFEAQIASCKHFNCRVSFSCRT